MAFNYWQKFVEGGTYHIYNRSINRENLFLSPDNYEFFLSKWAIYLNPFVDVMAYCLMPNHFHFIISIKSADDLFMDAVSKQKTMKSESYLNGESSINSFLEDQFKRLFSSYSLSFNKQNNRTGSLFQKRFKRVHITKDVKLAQIICYVHHNPYLHGFTIDFRTWIYSSYHAIISNNSTNVARDKILKWFNNSKSDLSVDEFIRYHNDYMEYSVNKNFLIE